MVKKQKMYTVTLPKNQMTVLIASLGRTTSSDNGEHQAFGSAVSQTGDLWDSKEYFKVINRLTFSTRR